MTLFNSLGSNYTLKNVVSSLTIPNNSIYEANLKKLLHNTFGGEAQFFYQGRQAITAALQSLSIPKSSYVAITGFTCFAVYQGVITTGCKPEYLDIEKDSLNFSCRTLELVYKKNPQIRAVIVQNTLGTPCDIEGIAHFCKKNNIYLIEDLAHCVGAVYDNKKLAGTIGDAVIFSFGRDKIIDAVSGGAIVMKHSKKTFVLQNISLTQKLRDRLYPFLTFCVRKLYFIKLGVVLHLFLKKTGLLLSTVSKNRETALYSLPQWHCKTAYDNFTTLDVQISHRRQIAHIYMKNLPSSCLFSEVVTQINNSSCLRFPLYIQNRDNLIEFLKQKGIYITDTWYDGPMSPKKYLIYTSYKNGDCPIAEDVAVHIINLPTHINVSEQDALEIAQEITIWLTTQ